MQVHKLIINELLLVTKQPDRHGLQKQPWLDKFVENKGKKTDMVARLEVTTVFRFEMEKWLKCLIIVIKFSDR